MQEKTSVNYAEDGQEMQQSSKEGEQGCPG